MPEQEITQELINKIYVRANQYAITRFDEEPDRLEIENGFIKAAYVKYYGDTDTSYEYISAENLTEDLDEVARQREEALAEQRRLAEIRRENERIEKEKRDKENRYRDFLKLKKEFEEQ